MSRIVLFLAIIAIALPSIGQADDFDKVFREPTNSPAKAAPIANESDRRISELVMELAEIRSELSDNDLEKRELVKTIKSLMDQIAQLKQSAEIASDAVPAEAIKKPFRAVLWGPPWCGVCRSNEQLLASGDPRFIFEHMTGSESQFPPEVLAYANGVFPAGTDCAGQQRGWPVWQIELANGSWGFADHARSADDLVAIHRLKQGEQLPRSTFTEAWQKRFRNQPPRPVPLPETKRKGPVAMWGGA